MDDYFDSLLGPELVGLMVNLSKGPSISLSWISFSPILDFRFVLPELCRTSDIFVTTPSLLAVSWMEF